MERSAVPGGASSTDFERLGERIAGALGGVPDDRFESVRASFLRRVGGVHARRVYRWVVLGLVVTGVGLGTGAVWGYKLSFWDTPSSPSTAEDLWLEGPKHGAATRVELGNGAHIDLVAGTRSRVHRDSDGRTRVTVEGGVIEMHVEANESQKWSFYAGPFLAKTAGGEFFLNYQPSQGGIVAGVSSGWLRISGGPLGADSVSLEAGQRLSAGGGSILVSSLQDDLQE